MKKFILTIALIYGFLNVANCGFTWDAQSTRANNFPDSPAKSPRIPKRMTLVGFREYLWEIAQGFIYAIEEYGFNNFEFVDMAQNISSHAFGEQVIGDVSYTKGFIDTVQGATFKVNSESYNLDEEYSTSSVSCTFKLVDIKIFYNYVAYLRNGVISGTVCIPFGGVEFKLTVNKIYKNGTVTGTINVMTLDAQKEWIFFPTSKEIEIIRRETRPNYPLPGVHSFFDDFVKLTKTTFATLLKHVVDSTPYPEICFDCAGY